MWSFLWKHHSFGHEKLWEQLWLQTYWAFLFAGIRSSSSSKTFRRKSSGSIEERQKNYLWLSKTEWKRSYKDGTDGLEEKMGDKKLEPKKRKTKKVVGTKHVRGSIFSSQYLQTVLIKHCNFSSAALMGPDHTSLPKWMKSFSLYQGFRTKVFQTKRHLNLFACVAIGPQLSQAAQLRQLFSVQF